ncbi:hypothetical protein FACS1894122_09890 [Alphaproteobacteria bacterium]|nr:hypothetical protein FACS1894122_09890 [Alphaproteobacteria bacterium]
MKASTLIVICVATVACSEITKDAHGMNITEAIEKTWLDSGAYEGSRNKQGIPHGKGKLTNQAVGFSYEGDFMDGKPHGTGKLIYSDGAAYEGAFVDGRPHGKGKVTFLEDSIYNGASYEADFKKGEIDGFVRNMPLDVLKLPMNLAGWNYTGNICNNRPIGEGIYINSDTGYSYRASDTLAFCDMTKDGYKNGNLTSPSGTTYEGDLRNGLPHGQGTLRHPDGSVIREGTFRISDGTEVNNVQLDKGIYTGEVNALGDPHGIGTMTYFDGSVYTGTFLNGQQNGEGTMVYSDGARYEGEFKYGKRWRQEEEVSVGEPVDEKTESKPDDDDLEARLAKLLQ